LPYSSICAALTTTAIIVAIGIGAIVPIAGILAIVGILAIPGIPGIPGIPAIATIAAIAAFEGHYIVGCKISSRGGI
jgi:hypothetical protein